MRTWYSFLLLSLLSVCFTTQQLHAQKIISGTVSSKKTGTIPGANIWIQDTFDGSSSDASGRFSFTTSKSDSLVLVVSAIGYAPLELALSSQSKNLHISLKPRVSQLNAVTITSGSIDISDRASAVVMKPLDVLTTAGAVGDITGALNTLPGTATVANDGRLFVRGGAASETAIFFDGLRVGSAYGTSTANLPTRNRFNPALFKGTFFSTGGYSAEYGDALSSVLVLETIDAPVRDQTDISLMTVGGTISTTRAGEKQSVTADVSYQNLAPYQELVKQEFDWEEAPKSYSGQVVYRHKWGKDGAIKAFVQHSQSTLTLWKKQPGDISRGQRIGVDNTFTFGNTSYKKPINDKWLASGGISASLNNDEFAIDTNRYRNRENLIHIKQ
ncbi:MAG TPA: TonB-dependent receptor, partial [Cryomorphaceae bacterium]|nr:TonB-dependent receptor [Cryomorphaceae bacterium]